MCFVGVKTLGLDVDTATGNLYFTQIYNLMRFTKNDNTLTDIFDVDTDIVGIAIDQLNR